MKILVQKNFKVSKSNQITNLFFDQFTLWIIKVFVFFLFVNMFSKNVFGQSTYSQSVTTYNWESPANAITTASCDDCDYTRNIGFTFNFFGNNYTQVNVNTNGLMTFGSTTNSFSNVCIPNSGAPNNIIAAYWDDLLFDFSCSPTYFREQTFGTAPNRYYVVSWIGFGRTGSSCGSYIYFQAKLYETSNIIEVHVQSNGLGTNNSGTIGIENSTGAVGYQAVCNSNPGGSYARRWTPIPDCTAPTVFTLTGGGTCLSGPSAVGLSGSQTGVNYQLKKNGVNEGAPVAGTGSAISFGNQTSGTYTVEASGSGYCTTTFASNVTVILNPLSLPNTITLCPSSTTTLSVVGEANSSGTNYTTTYNSSNGTMQTVFTGNGTFVNGSGSAITARTLLVGGGGGGAARHGAGGGGGGVLYNATMSIPAGNLPVVIGAGGGAGDYQNNVNHGNGIGAGGNGGNTTFNGSTAFGGGGGKTYENNTHATPGGSGGGGGGNTGTVNNGVSGGTQGNAGGAGPNTTNGNAGGGGGAGAAGGTASGNNGGNGGNGSNQSANFGTSVGQNGWFGGGGGGGSRANSTTCGNTGGTAGTGGVGGNGGGGRGGDLGNHTNGTAGLANTGGGGGGNRSCNTTANFAGFAGGSGVVILNYPAGIWSSSNTAVATVSQSGLVSVLSGAMAGQSAVITYTSVSGCSVTTTVLVSSNSAPIAIETANNLCSGTVTLSTTTPKPIAHYTFDGTLNDISGNGLHLTPISGTATYTENGLVLSGGGAMRFDSPSNSLLSNAVDYTIEFDFKQTAADGSYGKIFTWAPNGNRSPGIFHLPGGTNTGFHWRHDSDLNPCCGGNAGVNYQAGIALNQWYHVVGVRKGTRFELYVDGILVDSANDLPTDGRAGSAPFVFGAFPGNPAPAGTIIKNFKVFNNALEWYTGSCGGTFVSSEPSPIVNPASTSTYYVRNRNVCGTSSCTPIIVNRGPIPAVPTVSAGTPSICGSGTTTLVASGMAPGGQVATLGNNATDVIGGSVLSGHLNNHTMEFWVNPNRTIVLHSEINSGVSGDLGFPATEYSFAITPNQIGGVGCTVTNAGVGVSVGTNGVEVVQHGPCHFPVTLSFATAISGWTHIAVVHVSNVPHLFINGRLVRVGLESLYPTFPNTGTSFTYGYFGGSIDNVRAWSVARTQAQIVASMHLEVPTVVTGLVNHLPLNGNGTALAGSNATISGGTSFSNATYYTYTWSGGPALPTASTNQTQTTGTISTNGTHNYTVTATAGGCSGTASSVVAVTVNPNLPASVSIAASPNTNICLGTTVTFTATPTNGGTTPSYQWKVNGGNVGTNSTTFTSSSLVNGDVVTCVLTSNATPCLTGSPATSTGITMSIQASGSPLSGNESKTCVVNGNDWVRFYGSTGLLLGAIRANNNNLGNVTMQTLVSTPGVMNACAQPSNPLYSTVYMGRTWVMNSSAYPSGANFPSNVTVRLPFNNSELTSLNTAADASTTGNPNDGGTTTPATLANLMLTKITGATENGVANAADCASTILGITANAGTGTNYLSIASTSYIDFNVGQFSEFFLHKNNANMPLPVELISFSGICTEKGTELTWQTASESNNDYFILQRSRDGQNWEDLTTVSGNGNSTQLINYDWLDEAGFGGMYYRLTQVDFNGDRYEKQAIFVNCESESTKLNVYPNPTQADFTVEVNSTKEVESATISIIDVTGKALTHRNVEIHSGVNTFNFDEKLESGSYLIRVSIEGEIQTLRLVVKN